MSDINPEGTREELEAAMATLFPKIETAMRAIGLYMDSGHAATVGDGDKTIITASFIVGERAYSDEVLDPQAAQAAEELRPVLTEVEEQMIKDIQERYRRRRGPDASGD